MTATATLAGTTTRPGGDGVRRRVGARHVPLAALLNGVIAAGLRLMTVVEPDDGNIVPGSLGLVAER